MSNTDRGANPLYRPRSSGWVTGSVEMLDNVPVENGGPDRLLYTYNKDLGLLHLSKTNIRSNFTLLPELGGTPYVIATLPREVVGETEVIVPVGTLVFSSTFNNWIQASLRLRPNGDVAIDTNWTESAVPAIAMWLNLTIPMAGCGNGWPEASTT